MQGGVRRGSSASLELSPRRGGLPSGGSLSASAVWTDPGGDGSGGLTPMSSVGAASSPAQEPIGSGEGSLSTPGAVVSHGICQHQRLLLVH